MKTKIHHGWENGESGDNKRSDEKVKVRKII